jgi:ankyrin repeat protein
MRPLFILIIIFSKLTLANEVGSIDLESLGLDDFRVNIVATEGREDSKNKLTTNKPILKKLSLKEREVKNKEGAANDSKKLQNSPEDKNSITFDVKNAKSQLGKVRDFLSKQAKNAKENIKDIKREISNALSSPPATINNNKDIKVKVFGDDVIEEVSNIIRSKESKRKNNELHLEKWNLEQKYELNKSYPKPVAKIAPDFLTTDIPPALLSRKFSDQNIHHPILRRYSDKVDLLFNEIGINDINDFNAIVRQIFNVNIYNEFGDTPLLFAVSLKRQLISTSLLAAGANPDLKNSLGLTSVNIAIKMGDYEMVKLLVESGADLDIRDGFGETYLMQAVRIGYLPVIDYLAAKNINLNAINKKNFSAFDIAKMSNNNVIFQLLSKYSTKKRVMIRRSIINDLEGKWGESYLEPKSTLK